MTVNLRCVHGRLSMQDCDECASLVSGTYTFGIDPKNNPAATSGDTINPAHYKTGKVEVIDFIREQLGDEGFVAYCRGNAIKYHARAGKKGIAPSAEDLAKAGWYSAMAAHVGDPSKYPDPRGAK